MRYLLALLLLTQAACGADPDSPCLERCVEDCALADAQCWEPCDFTDDACIARCNGRTRACALDCEYECGYR